MSDTAIRRYLTHYGASVAEQYAGRVGSKHRHAVVIPMYDESPESLHQIFKHHPGPDTLAIAVVNAPANAPEAALARTRALLDRCADTAPVQVLVVDCVTQPLQPRAGVGLARKIGTDIALTLYLQGKLSYPWLYQTDADALLPPNYFAQPLPVTGAVVFNHLHVSHDQQLAAAARLYDLHMRYYVAGLAAAGSRFAYPTLGSTLAVHAHSYAAVRGYPKRNAAEDFYLLNKIAKVHGVARVREVQITLQARLSHRVPFGTGPALQSICAGLQQDPSGESYLSYNSASFELLAQTLAYLRAFAARPAVDSATTRACTARQEQIETLLEHLRFDKVRDTIANRYDTPRRRQEALNDWFDAGKTLRFIHAARRFHADQPLLRTLRSLPANIRNQMQSAPAL